MRDFLPADVRKREYVIGIIKQVYESYGFEPLETPAVENIDTLMGKYGDEGNQLIFKILKRGGKLDEAIAERGTRNSELSDLALRYDLTVPLARVVANNRNDLPKFFKRYQIQPVWRADRPARGRFREFYQCDVDAIGSRSMMIEAELILAASGILDVLGFRDYQIRVNHRLALGGILDAAGVSSEQHIDALTALDKIDKIGRVGVEKEFLQRGITHNSSAKLLAFFEFFLKQNAESVFGPDQQLRLLELQQKSQEQIEIFQLASSTTSTDKADIKRIEEWHSKTGSEYERMMTGLIGRFIASGGEDKLREMVHEAKSSGPTEALAILKTGSLNESLILETLNFAYPNEDALFGLGQLLDLLKMLRNTDVAARVVFDPTLARGLSYYTGTIMEINIPDLAGSLGGGGRYDGLIGMFGKEQIPACGFSLGLERILVVMEERGMFPPEIAESSPADVLVTIWSDETAAESLKLAQELRSSGLRVTLYPEPDKLGKQIKYADSIKVPFVCVLGESEIAGGTVTIKNMKAGDQQTLSRGRGPRGKAGPCIVSSSPSFSLSFAKAIQNNNSKAICSAASLSGSSLCHSRSLSRSPRELSRSRGFIRLSLRAS
jgi:histidyl-tRNA synthetase